MPQTSPGVGPLVRLPEPWKTTYEVTISAGIDSVPLFSLVLSRKQLSGSSLPPEPLHLESLRFSDLGLEPNVPTPGVGDNSLEARYHRSLISLVSWNTSIAPSASQIWNLAYAIVTRHPEVEDFRLELTGPGATGLSDALRATGLASRLPKFISTERSAPSTARRSLAWIMRSSFWQGAGSPFGTRPVWVANPDLFGHLSKTLTSVPAFPYEHTVTFSLEGRPVHAQHPVRPPKPAHGAVIYSRYIPHLDEFFSMVHFDWRNKTHLQLFHDWQNDPRVAAGWNETGSLEQHREYLRKIDEDPHQMSILARFNDTYFAYFEVYWAKVRKYISYIPRSGDLHCLEFLGGPHGRLFISPSW
ncbi:hypothetical protein LTR84_002444 [Exophiala bonariae]|uniref:Acyltransferase MbtK/IucB-like conserved domain-containing protein n=1 Tax=Exophiala bonariae TaxID=1690606 RepID=A0AAV9NBT6_9EURO|nr:hypothetical protein LTR84_002444 [Exophiala bonariae]